MGKTKIKFLGDGEYTLQQAGRPPIKYSKGVTIEVDKDVADELLARLESGKQVWEAVDATAKTKTNNTASPASN